MSPLTQAMVINGVVLFAVLEADLGGHRTIGPFRIARPLLMSAAIVPMYLTALATAGAGLALEIAAVASGLGLGLLAASQLSVYRSPKTGRPVSAAGLGYGAVWTTVVGARATFSYGATHWFAGPLGGWMVRHHVTAADLTNALVLMAVAMVLTRTIGMATRALRTGRHASTAANDATDAAMSRESSAFAA
jgi:hypothetical protein